MRQAAHWLLSLLFGAALVHAAPVVQRPLDVSNESAPSFTVYTAQDGLSDEVWNALGTDGDDFVWAGSASELARFDGYRWQLWPTPSARSLVMDLMFAEGQLWAIFQREGLYRYDGRSWHAVDTGSRALALFHRSPRADGGEDLWIGHDHGLLRRVGEQWIDDPGNDSIEPQTPYGVTRTERLLGGRPRQWLATQLGVFYRELHGDQPEGPWQQLDDARFANLAGTDIIRTIDHGVEELWVTTYGQGVYRIRDDGVRVWRAATGELPSEAIYGGVATAEPDGTRLLWLSSRAGLLRIRGDDVSVFDRRHGLPSDAVRTLMLQRAADGTDLLWLATEGGIARAALGSQQWRTVSLMGARENGIFSVMIEPDGSGGERLWVGTAKEGMGLLQQGQWRYFRKSEGTLPFEGVRQIWRITGPDGTPWRLMSLGEGGLWRIDDQLQFSRIPAPWDTAPADTAMFALAREHGGVHELWFTTFRNGVYRWRNGQWRQFIADGAAPPWQVPRLAESIDATGRSWLWGASNQGLARFDGERWEMLSAIDGLPDDGYRGVAVLQDDGRPVLWAGSQRYGVVRLDISDALHPDVLPANELPPPPDTFVYGAMRDRSGRTYVCTNNGVQQLTLDDRGRWRTRVFRRREGLVHDECNTNAQMLDAQDRYWVGTLAGLSVFDPRIDTALSVPTRPPQLRISALQVDGVAQRPGDPLRLPAGSRELRIDYGLLATHRELDSNYRSQLIGYDPQPEAWTDEHGRTFTGLPPGSYRFAVEAQDFAGRAAQPHSFEFVVEAFWWQLAWVRIAAALSAALLLFLAVRAYVRVLRGRQRLLEQQVAARTAELNAANHQLTQLSYLDALTGIPNRRRLMQAMEGAIARAVERQRPLGVIVIDVDHFKDYNDRFGHLSGDTALRAVAQALASATREHDLIARHGGEEFACLMVDAAPEIVLAVAERMRALVEALPPRALGNDTQTLTLSAGVLCRVPRIGDSPAELLDAADAALYRAKREGRNRICRAD